MLEDSVSMIPFALLAGKIQTEKREWLEVRLEKASDKGFVFRTSQKVTQVLAISLFFYQETTGSYKELTISDFQVDNIQRKKFFCEYQIMTDDYDYSRLFNNLLKQYYSYIMLKLEGGEEAVSQSYMDISDKQMKTITNVFEDQKVLWYHAFQKNGWNQQIREKLSQTEIAVTLDNPKRYVSYLEQDAISFMKTYVIQNQLQTHPLAQEKLSRLYIGNESCHNLFPSQTLLNKLMEKAREEKLQVTLVFTYLRETLIPEYAKRLEDIYAWCKEMQFPVEIVVNDWGMLELIREKEDYFTPILGILLNKRKKDPRIPYLAQSTQYQEKINLAENAGNSSFYTQMLQEKCHIYRLETESCGYRMQIPKGRHSLHLPYYQTNTSQYCPLYAVCKEKGRHRQYLVNGCPKYCEEYVLSYPDALHMVGRYNSIYGFDEEILTGQSLLYEYLNSGIDRIVLNFL